jgi:hypothetical protein
MAQLRSIQPHPLHKPNPHKRPRSITALHTVVLQPALLPGQRGGSRFQRRQLVCQQGAGEAFVGVLAAFGLHFHTQSAGLVRGSAPLNRSC